MDPVIITGHICLLFLVIMSAAFEYGRESLHICSLWVNGSSNMKPQPISWTVGGLLGNSDQQVKEMIRRKVDALCNGKHDRLFQKNYPELDFWDEERDWTGLLFEMVSQANRNYRKVGWTYSNLKNCYILANDASRVTYFKAGRIVDSWKINDTERNRLCDDFAPINEDRDLNFMGIQLDVNFLTAKFMNICLTSYESYRAKMAAPNESTPAETIATIVFHRDH